MLLLYLLNLFIYFTVSQSLFLTRVKINKYSKIKKVRTKIYSHFHSWGGNVFWFSEVVFEELWLFSSWFRVYVTLLILKKCLYLVILTFFSQNSVLCWFCHNSFSSVIHSFLQFILLVIELQFNILQFWVYIASHTIQTFFFFKIATKKKKDLWDVKSELQKDMPERYSYLCFYWINIP